MSGSVAEMEAGLGHVFSESSPIHPAETSVMNPPDNPSLVDFCFSHHRLRSSQLYLKCPQTLGFLCLAKMDKETRGGVERANIDLKTKLFEKTP